MLIWLISLFVMTLWIIPTLAYLTGTYTNEYLVYWLLLILFFEFENNYRFQNWVFKNKVKYKLKSMKDTENVLTDVILKKDNGDLLKIDHIVVNRFGVFVFEDREYFGKVTGDILKNEWKYEAKRHTYNIENPVKKCKDFAKTIKKIVDNKNVSVFHVVVFNENVVVDVDNKGSIFSIKNLNTLFNNKVSNGLSQQDIAFVFNTLRNADLRWKTNVKPVKESRGICPICGNEIVEYISKDSDSILVCKSYPRCIYTKGLKNKKI